MVLIALGQLELSFQLVAPPLGKPGPLGLDQKLNSSRFRRWRVFATGPIRTLTRYQGLVAAVHLMDP